MTADKREATGLDVLAVMDTTKVALRHLALHHEVKAIHTERYTEALAAVKELMAAAQDAEAAIRKYAPNALLGDARLRAAINRMKGA